MREVISRPIQALFGNKINKLETHTAIQKLLELIPEPALVYDPEGNRVLFVNSAFLVLSAYSQQEVINENLENLLENPTRDEILREDITSGLLRTRNRLDIPVELRKSLLDQQTGYLVLKVIPRTDLQYLSGDWQKRLITTFQTIPRLVEISTERWMETIQRLLEVLKGLFETNLICIYQAGADFPELRKLISLEELTLFPDTLPSSDLIRLSSPVLWTPGKRMITQLHRSARIAGVNYVASVSVGKENALEGLIVVGGMETQPPPLLLETMEVLAIYVSQVISRSVLEANNRREAARKEFQLHLYTSVYEEVQEGILVVNPDSVIIEINPAAELLFGYTRNEVQGERIENILITPDRFLPALANVMTTKASTLLENITLHRRNGQTFAADVRIVPIQYDSHLSGVVLLVRDISEHEQILAQSRQLEQRAFLGEFMGVFAHEVLNPINNISTGLQILSRRLASENSLQDLVSRMENDCERLHHQMEALKTYAKPYEPKQELVDIPQLLNRIVERWRPRMERLNIRHVFQSAEKLPPVIGDWRALDQVFNNLISNAIDAMKENGGVLSVKVSLSTMVSNRPHLEIAVSDNGPGIPDDIREKIFEPFVTTKSSGTGLGLSITKRIVTAHRGSITFNSYPGATVFRIFLPASEET
ncbi:MAG: ATP-binding protein [Chloroflexota bacterium]